MSNIKISKKIILITLGILLVLSLLVGVSYAYYIVTHSQTNSNIVKSTCISLSLTNEQNDISLDKQYPISDEAGASLIPYSFTITNTCRNAISYNLNLEMLEGTTLDSKYVKTMLNDNIVNLASLDATDTNITTSTEARTLTKGALASEESINYEFRMWMDSNTEADSDSMNKEFLAKIVVTGVPTKVYNFDYTGAEQVFTTPQTGMYKIETWGAQGGQGITGSTTTMGGYGGYSFGITFFSKDEKIYLNVGQIGVDGNEEYTSGSDVTILRKSYNGGGAGNVNADCNWGGGGGATHMATKSGIFSSLENYKENILIVSGGGGGSGMCIQADLNSYHYGGDGGGYIGNAVNGSCADSAPTGGTQNTGGIEHYGNYAGTFGQGGTHGSGGGGGYYGGSYGWNCCSGAGGGSGYIGNSLLTNKAMYCYNCEESSEESTKTISTTCAEETPTSNCAKKGNGYARITYIG